MKKIRILTSAQEIEDACALLYDIYIERMQWSFPDENPSGLRVEKRNGRNILLDRFVDLAVWFGVFDENVLVACIRLQGTDENGKLELEGYESSKPVHQYLPSNRNKCFELTKFAILPDHIAPGIIKNLFFEAFKYCEEVGYSLSCCTSNNFLKKFYQRIKYPLKSEQAFKYAHDDPAAVNHYFADFSSGEIRRTLLHLKKSNLSLSSKKNGIIRALEIAAPVLPIPVYWHDSNGVVLGVNEHCLKAIGTSRHIIGKTPYEFYPSDIAAHILNHNDLVMATGNILAQEERIKNITTEKSTYFSSIKAPLYDEDGLVIGIVGTSIDITAEKEAERLKSENERLEIENRYQNKLIKEQKIFKEIIDQAVHDIRSPLASLLIVSSYTKSIPEEISDVISGASKRINDIANNLLEKYRPENDKNNSKSSSRREKSTFQISLALQEIVSEKKYEFYNLDVEFKVIINPAGYLTFIYAEEASFKRMISNLINNAVEALNNKSGLVNLILDVEDALIKITVEDNGKGMPEHIVDKVMNDISVTDGKKEGHGIGLAQVRDTLQRNDGYLSIDSRVGEGTRITLSFAKKQQPHWVAEHIEMSLDDVIVILDDDSSIHKAWELRLRDRFPHATVKYFEQGSEALQFIEKFTLEQRGKILFLADYELLHQEINGLEIVKQSQVERSFLVTSRFSNRNLQSELEELKIKMLPKLYISEVPILIV